MWDDLGPDVLAFDIVCDDATVRVIANLGQAPLPLPADAGVLVASVELGEGGTLPTDAAVWLRQP